MDRDAEIAHAGGLAERIHDRGGVHPQLDYETEQHLQVPVLGRHGRDDGAEAEGEACHHQDQQREQQGVPGQVGRAARIYKEIHDIDDDEESELDDEPQEVADDVRDRHHQPWEIDLTENAGVVDEGIGRLGEAFGEIVPHAGTGEVEQRPGNAVGRDAGDAAEYDHVHQDRKGRLDHEPDRSEDRLLVLGDDVALDKQGTKVPVIP